MFRASMKYETLNEIADIPLAVVRQVRVDFTPDGIDLKAVDGAHVAMIALKYNKNIYSAFSGEATSIAFDIKKLQDSLKNSKNGQIIEVSVDDTNTLIMKFGDIITKSKLLSMTDFQENIDIPNIDLPSYFVMNLADFSRGVQAGSSVGEELQIDATDQFVKFHSETSLDTIDLRIVKERLVKFDIKEAASSVYPMKILKDTLSKLPGVEQIVVHIGSNLPMRLDFDLSGGLGKGRFLLAPKVMNTN